ncbi:sentrin-specific protease 1-like [Tetranychus urticae]|uniref:sentrin-specific protease 1-like n=1 Tax=Tetranychus urticae TaxID=32264 RepID=UPI00077BC156|nr:sentrin-specific protease 1-like [Tetranychus urticae]
MKTGWKPSRYIKEMSKAKRDRILRRIGPFALKPAIVNFKLLFFPIHLPNHWALICINMDEKSINYYDSIKRNDPSVLLQFHDWMAYLYPCSEWSMKNWTEILQQVNTDCGMFTCQFGALLASGICIDDVHYTENDIKEVRQSILWSLSNLSLKLQNPNHKEGDQNEEFIAVLIVHSNPSKDG